MAFKMTSPFAKKSKVKGGGTKKVCLPLAKIRSMSKAERQRLLMLNVPLLEKVSIEDQVNLMLQELQAEILSIG